MIEGTQDNPGPGQQGDVAGGIEGLMTEWARPSPGEGSWDTPAAPAENRDMIGGGPYPGAVEPPVDMFPPEPPPEFVGGGNQKLRAGARVTAAHDDDVLGPWRRQSRPAASFVPTILAVFGFTLGAYFALIIESPPLAVFSSLLGLVGGLFCRALLRD